MKEVFIVAAKRTPQGSFGGALSHFSAVELGTLAVQAAKESAQIPTQAVDELFFGQVIQANAGQAPARQVALKAGLGEHVPSTTVNKVCASGMKAVMFGAQSIQLDQNQIVIAGGMESMSQVPHYLAKARYGYGYGGGELIDGLQRDGLVDVYQSKPMGCYADATAAKYQLTREAQDAYAIRSYQRATQAWEHGFFQEEVVTISWQDKKGKTWECKQDEEFRKVQFEKISTLRPAFTPDGTVTAANASTINDGAAALIMASAEAVAEFGLKPLARILSYADAATSPEWFTIAPIAAAQKALDRAQLSFQDIGLIEVNEAFSAVPMAFAQHFSCDENKLNVLGGGVALGHPLGASGARIIVTLTHLLQRTKTQYGLAAICNGGGGASAMIIERM